MMAHAKNLNPARVASVTSKTAPKTKDKALHTTITPQSENEGQNGANIYTALMRVQQELKAPKNQRNTFGDYMYRSCEDILEAVKPLLVKNNLVLMLSDTVEPIAQRIYVKATATLIGYGETISTSAYAREEEAKKGMDGAQITGASSSYARKYALNGLFLIDDTKDADTQDNSDEAPTTPAIAPAQTINQTSDRVTDKQLSMIASQLATRGLDLEVSNKMTKKRASQLIERLMDQDLTDHVITLIIERINREFGL